MSDIIYDIYSVYLYDNQLSSDFAILSNENELNSYRLSLVRDKNSFNINSDSIKKYYDNVIDNINEILTNEKIKEVREQYSIYNIFWNETKSGINLCDWKFIHLFYKGIYSTYRINEYIKENNIYEKRQKLLRVKKLERIVC